MSFGKVARSIINFLYRLNKNFPKSTLVHWSCSIDKSVQIGAHTYVGRNTCITKTSIGKYCSIANNVSIGQGEHNYTRFSTSTHFAENPFEELTEMPCAIGNDVWIGVGAVILRGVTVSDGAVIGANAGVTNDVPPYAIVAGVPARVIKYRFSEEKISELHSSRWWEYDAETLRAFSLKEMALGSYLAEKKNKI